MFLGTRSTKCCRQMTYYQSSSGSIIIIIIIISSSSSSSTSSSSTTAPFVFFSSPFSSSLGMSPWWSLCSLYSSPTGWNHRRRLESLLLCACLSMCDVNCSRASTSQCMLRLLLLGSDTDDDEGRDGDAHVLLTVRLCWNASGNLTCILYVSWSCCDCLMSTVLYFIYTWHLHYLALPWEKKN